ncbi:MAG: hypothetical protein C5B47_08725 [Verrucomicrobia bacterium]|nr:MAG: hypothetical protein C5B47_08725 [Verrucomicrobiota bacterium]
MTQLRSMKLRDLIKISRIREVFTSQKKLAKKSVPEASHATLPPAPHGFAYLFETFPSFTQTFCFREVNEMLNQGLRFPIFAMWLQENDSPQNFPAQLEGLTTYFPKDIRRWVKKSGPEKRAEIRSLQVWLEGHWGRDKKRAEEVTWIRPILEKIGVRHVHAHFAGVAARTAYWLKKTAGIRYSFTAHANDFWVNSDKKHLDDLIGEAEFVIMETDFSVNWLATRFPSYRDRIHRVYNGISLDRFVRKRAASHPPRILSIGRYIEKKGFFDLIKACAILKDEAFECLIVGQGALENDLKKEVRAAGLEGKVLIVGPKTENEIADLLSSASIFVLACKTASDGGMDNLPTVIVEAMTASVPVVSTHVAGIPEMVIHGETGYLVAEGDCNALASSLRTLLRNPQTAIKMGERGRIVAQSKFDISATVSSLRSLFTRYGALR